MKVRLFDPEGVRPEDYKSRYPELLRTEEFEGVGGMELIFIWYFANKTSPLVNIADPIKRVERALEESGWRLPADTRKKILALQFGEMREKAIEKMSSYEPGPRYVGWQAIKTIFEQYQKIIEEGPGGFVKTTGSGEDRVESTDTKAYVDTSAKIRAELPKLISQMEEGFGISIVAGDSDDKEEGVLYLREWNFTRQQQ